MRKYAATIALALSACSPAWSEPKLAWSEPGTITVCVALPTKHLPQAREAVEQWDRALRKWKRVLYVESLPAEHCDKTVQEVEPWQADDTNDAAWVPMIGGSEIFMVRGRYERDVQAVLAHEIGHSLGAQHLGGGLMDPVLKSTTPRCPDAATVAQVAGWNRVDLSILSWCAR